MSTVTEQMERSTAARLTAVFVHGRWPLPSRWDDCPAVEIRGRGRAPTIDRGWRGMAGPAPAFVTRCV
jgi:hypothetical protein